MKDALTVPAVPIPLRDYLASQALAGLLVNSRPHHPFQTEKDWLKLMAERSYLLADTLMAHRSIPPKDGAKS